MADEANVIDEVDYPTIRQFHKVVDAQTDKTNEANVSDEVEAD